MTDIVIAAIHKNSKEEVRVALTRYEGHDLLALRVYFQPSDGAVISYRTSGTDDLDVVFDIAELAELQDIVERGPDWNTITKIVVTLELVTDGVIALEATQP